MIIDGKAIAAKRLEGLRFKIQDLKIKPKLVAVLVGNDPASEMYVKMKSKRAGEAGIESEVIILPANISRSELIKRIEELNRDSEVIGILVQLPLPENLRIYTDEILQTI